MQLLKTIVLLCSVVYLQVGIAQSDQGHERAGKWLQNSLDQYFADKLVMEQLTTIRYCQFKTDAMGMSFYGGLGQKEFEDKWRGVYDINEPFVHDGFLVPLQDWNDIAVECRFIYADKQNLWFNLGITETPSNTFFSRYIKVVPDKGAFRIDDVIEVIPGKEYIEGDFNGDRTTDTLAVSLISLMDNRPITIDTALAYDSLISTIASRKPILQLTGQGLGTLVLNADNFYILGLDLLQNIGNINKFRGDEIAVILSAADWSNMNTCHVYSFYKRGWKRIKSIEIKEEDIPQIKSGKFKPWNGPKI